MSETPPLRHEGRAPVRPKEVDQLCKCDYILASEIEKVGTVVSVPVREFKANLSKYLKLARSSPEGIEITSHGKAVARVIGLPAAVAHDAVGRLIASGAAQWSGCRPVWKRVALAAGGRSISVMVLDDRR